MNTKSEQVSEWRNGWKIREGRKRESECERESERESIEGKMG